MIIKHFFQIIGIVHLFTGVWQSDCRLSWSEHVSQVWKSFVQRVEAKQMKYLPVKTLQEIYFKTTIPSLIYCILIWGTALQPFFLLWNRHIWEKWELFSTLIVFWILTGPLSLIFIKNMSLYSCTRFNLIPCLFGLMNCIWRKSLVNLYEL